MPAATSCPVSEVDRALSPYVNSRQETQRIRKALARYLDTHIKPTDAKPRHLDLECPDVQVRAGPDTSAVNGSRSQYIKALQARSEAQMRLNKLQGSLEDLRTSYTTEFIAQTDSAYDNEVTRSYIGLLRQQRRFAELEVVQDSLEKLLNAKPEDSHKELKLLVKETIGEQPDLPAERLDQLSQAPSNNASLFKLKKEVLEAKASMDHANATKSKAHARSTSSPDLAKQVYALSLARDELVGWVEGELGKLNEESELLEDASPIKRWPQTSTPPDLETSKMQISKAYDAYTEARSSVIRAYTSAQRPTTANAEPVPNQINGVEEGQPATGLQSSRTVAKILPYLPQLAVISNNERSLLQQAVYLQSQLSTADDEIAESLLRLAEESHLLTSGDKGLTAWGRAAAQADASTEGYVSSQLEEIGQEVNHVRTVGELSSLHSKVLNLT